MASCPTETGEMAPSLNWKKFNGKKFSLDASNNENFYSELFSREYLQQ